MPGSSGQIDLIWINGKNFATLANASLLYGPYTSALPNAAFYNLQSPLFSRDFGTPTAGLEMPYNAAQIALVYNPQLVPNPPTNFSGLLTWIQAHPGLFAWPIPTEANDYTAAALMRMMVATTCTYGTYATSSQLAAQLMTLPAFADCTTQLWAKFNALAPSLYGYDSNSSLVRPPKGMGEVDELFSNGTVAWSWSYNPLYAAAKVSTGEWAAGRVRSTVLDGSVRNANFVTIPRNAPSLAAALVVANEIASPAQVYARAKPSGWGALPAMNPAKLPTSWSDLIGDLSSVKSDLTPSLAELAAAAMPELPVNVQLRLEADWLANVGRRAALPWVGA